jgi:hypothetical protein
VVLLGRRSTNGNKRARVELLASTSEDDDTVEPQPQPITLVNAGHRKQVASASLSGGSDEETGGTTTDTSAANGQLVRASRAKRPKIAGGTTRTTRIVAVPNAGASSGATAAPVVGASERRFDGTTISQRQSEPVDHNDVSANLNDLCAEADTLVVVATQLRERLMFLRDKVQRAL